MKLTFDYQSNNKFFFFFIKSFVTQLTALSISYLDIFYKLLLLLLFKFSK